MSDSDIQIVKFESGRVIDCSHYQKITDLDKLLTGGVIGMIHKATEGIGLIDAKFYNRRAAWKGLFGEYHFLRCYGKATGADEAKYFLDEVQPKDSDLIMLDAEAQNLTLADLIYHSEEFVQQIYQDTKRYPYFYMSNYNLTEACNLGFIADDSILLECKLDIARYGHVPVVPKPFDHWTLHQYTDSEKDDFITSVDGDHYHGTTGLLYEEWSDTPPEEIQA